MALKVKKEEKTTEIAKTKCKMFKGALKVQSGEGRRGDEEDE